MNTSSHNLTTLRRADREITDRATIEAILRRAEVGRLGLAVDNAPYVVPLNYVYHNGAIYFHSAHEGRKIVMLKANPQVCFEVDEHYGTVRSNKPMSHSTHYASVVVFGQAQILADLQQKCEILQALLDKYAPGRHYRALRIDEANNVTVVEIRIKAMTGKTRAPFYPGDKVRLRLNGEPDVRLGAGVFEVEMVDEAGLVHLNNRNVCLPWERFESYFGPGDGD
ncbi:MAG: pyridoxamine 5'-phosphate oxidase family protein [Anaerolineae bacterium]|nr:pyridoxamine 5'-phosphate oxidase family protein [Anaerolineae bacterium]